MARSSGKFGDNAFIFRLLISSSIGFFLGNTRLVRPRCSAPKILPSICRTSSDVLNLYVWSTLSIWFIACWRWLAASWICWIFQGKSCVIEVRCIWGCCRKILKFMSACVMLSPVNVTTHLSWSWGAVNTNLSCFLPSLPYKGTGNLWTHSTKIECNCFRTAWTSSCRTHSNSICWKISKID